MYTVCSCGRVKAARDWNRFGPEVIEIFIACGICSSHKKPLMDCSKKQRMVGLEGGGHHIWTVPWHGEAGPQAVPSSTARRVARYNAREAKCAAINLWSVKHGKSDSLPQYAVAMAREEALLWRGGAL